MSGGNPPEEHRFKKGQSGNPRGRPKGSMTLTGFLRKALWEGDAERAKRIIDAMITKAEEGDISHIREILNRIDGKVLEKTETDGTVRVVVTYQDTNDGTDDQPDTA